MSSYHSATGYVLKTTARNEQDSVYTLFTREFGHLELLVKAARKIDSKLQARLQIGDLVLVDFVQGRNQKTLIEAQLLKRPYHIRQDLTKLRVLFEIAALFDKLVKDE